MSHSGNSLWLSHLEGARDLILHRGGPRKGDYLTRFFSLLDVSASIFACAQPLLDLDYMLEEGVPAIPGDGQNRMPPNWPAYDIDRVSSL